MGEVKFVTWNKQKISTHFSKHSEKNIHKDVMTKPFSAVAEVSNSIARRPDMGFHRSHTAGRQKSLRSPDQENGIHGLWQRRKHALLDQCLTMGAAGSG